MCPFGTDLGWKPKGPLDQINIKHVPVHSGKKRKEKWKSSLATGFFPSELVEQKTRESHYLHMAPSCIIELKVLMEKGLIKDYYFRSQELKKLDGNKMFVLLPRLKYLKTFAAVVYSKW